MVTIDTSDVGRSGSYMVLGQTSYQIGCVYNVLTCPSLGRRPSCNFEFPQRICRLLSMVLARA